MCEVAAVSALTGDVVRWAIGRMALEEIEWMIPASVLQASPTL
jgi:hypothetical protein